MSGLLTDWAALHPTDRLLVLGGTFDPIHNGHLQLLDIAWQELGGMACLLPAGDPPHKREIGASAEQRLYMAHLAAQPHWMVAEDEITLSPSYTIHTLQTLRDIAPKLDLWMVVGQDAFLDMGGWYRPDKLFELANWAVALRPPLVDQIAAVEKTQQQYGQAFGARVRILSKPGPQISATKIRERIANNHSGDILQWLPQPVWQYIQQQRLYQGGR